MFVRPKQLAVASALALAGALISLVAAFFMLGSEDEATDKLVIVGMTLLISVMFLAISGSFSANSRWPWKASMIFIFLTATLIVVAFMYGLSVEILAPFQFLLVLVIALLASGRQSSSWFELNRA